MLFVFYKIGQKQNREILGNQTLKGLFKYNLPFEMKNNKNLIFRLDFLCGAGSVAVVTAIVLLIDFIFTVRQGVRGDLD